MNKLRRGAAAGLAGVICCAGAMLAASPAGFPFADEALSYSIVWPSGLSLGEAHLQAAHSGSRWNFDLKVDASLPAYTIQDRYQAAASSALCSDSFERKTTHGAKKTAERITVGAGSATRETIGGGTSEIAIASCAHDALTFLFFVRRELGQGRVPPAQTVLFGAGYPIQLQYAGQQTVLVNGVPADSDKVIATVHLQKGGDYTFEMYFARDAARTPLVMRAPFAIGTFSAELQR